jgi:hypothetical protein
MKKSVWITMALLCICTLAATAQEAPPLMTPEQQKQMEAFVKAMTPGEPHKLLDHMTGTWDAKVTMWEAPGAPPQSTEGISEVKWILGGRYLQERMNASLMGMSFEGLGHTGYDNVKKQYWSSWVDNMSTGMMTSTGQTKDNGKTYTFWGSMADPMTGKDQKLEQKVVVESNDKHWFEMWGAAPDGKNFKMMEIVYTRKK